MGENNETEIAGSFSGLRKADSQVTKSLVTTSYLIAELQFTSLTNFNIYFQETNAHKVYLNVAESLNTPFEAAWLGIVLRCNPTDVTTLVNEMVNILDLRIRGNVEYARWKMPPRAAW